MIRAGLAVGPLRGGRTDGLVEALHRPEWNPTLWLVSHVDLHRTPKVQAVLRALQGLLD